MAKKGKSYGGYGASVQSSILQNIIRGQSGMGSTATPTGISETTGKLSKSQASIPNDLRELRQEKAIAEYQTLTPEQRAAKYADDPVLSGRFTNVQDTLAGLYKYQSVQNLLPKADDPNYAKKMNAYNKAAANLTTADQEAYKAFFQLGGTFGSKGAGVNYGFGANVLDTFLGNTTATPGMNINTKTATGSPSGLGMSLPGMNQKTGQMNLSQNQLGKLKTLKGIKQAGGTLSAKQKSKLQRLRDLKNT
jgi:hypothetical protein